MYCMRCNDVFSEESHFIKVGNRCTAMLFQAVFYLALRFTQVNMNFLSVSSGSFGAPAKQFFACGIDGVRRDGKRNETVPVRSKVFQQVKALVYRPTVLHIGERNTQPGTHSHCFDNRKCHLFFPIHVVEEHST